MLNLNYLTRFLFFLTVTALFACELCFCQEMIIKPELLNSTRKDSNSFYFKEIWITSKDVNSNDARGFMRRAYDKVNLGYLSEALSDIEKSISLDSTLPGNYYMKGLVMLRLNSPVAAYYSFRKAIAHKDTNAYTYFYTAETCVVLGKNQTADSLFNIAIQKNSKFADAYFSLGNLHFLKRESTEAEINYERAIEADPHYAPAYFNLAIIYGSKNQSKALRYLDKCSNSNPGFAPAYFMKSILYIMQNNFPFALKNINLAVGAEPANLYYKVIRSLLYIYNTDARSGIRQIAADFNMSNTTELVDDFINRSHNDHLNEFVMQVAAFNEFSDRLSEDEKIQLIFAIGHFVRFNFYEAEDIYLNLSHKCKIPGLVSYMRGINLENYAGPDKALSFFTDAVNINPHPSRSYLSRGIILESLGRHQEAVNDLSLYIEQDNSFKSAYDLRGKAYAKLWNHDKAITDFSRSLKLDSTDAEIYHCRAESYLKQNNYNDAIKDLSNSLRYRNKDPETACLLSECYFITGDTLKAYNLLNETAERFNKLTEKGNFIRGTINLLYKKYDFAVRDFSNVINKNTGDIESLVYRGLAYYCKERFTDAIADFTKALELDKFNITALYTRGLANIKLRNYASAYDDLKKAEQNGHPLAKRAILLYLKDYLPAK